MSDSLFSSSWYRVNSLVPKIRNHVQIHRHIYRGVPWYVLQDHSTGKFFRFTSEAHVVIGLMDGLRTINDIWEKACERLGDNMPTQDEVIQLLSRLHNANALQSDIQPDTEELFLRLKDERKKRLIQKIKSPLSIRVPLLDLDSFISRTDYIGKAIYSMAGAILWLLVISGGALLANIHWTELSENVADRVLNIQNLVIAGLLYPIIKLFHELGHAYAVKRWGGEVHEIGIMFLVFMPVPYVDASSSSAFRAKWKRMLVAAAGILMEMFIAALAMIIWANMEPGFARSMAFNTMLIAGVSTVFFNGNPLLKFDAYYVLSDYLEIPNLGNRSNSYIAFLFKKYLFKLKELDLVAHTNGEASWMVLYAITSYIYRMFVMFFIVILVSGKFFFVGILLAVWAIYTAVVSPLVKIIKYLVHDKQLRRKRVRVISSVLVLLSMVLVPLAIFPIPLYTVAEGIVMAEDNSQLRIEADGFLSSIVKEPGSIVEKGDLLIVSDDPEILSRVNILKAQLNEYRVSKQASIDNIAEYHILEEEIIRAQAELARMQERQQHLYLRSHRDGVFVLNERSDILGRYLKRGAAVGYVVRPEDLYIIAIVKQEDVNLVRLNTRNVAVRFSENIMESVPALVDREIPAASNDLPSMALSVKGGGNIVLDPQQNESMKAYESLFQFEINIEDMQISNIGERAYVRFAHDDEALIYRMYRGFRQVFLDQYDI